MAGLSNLSCLFHSQQGESQGGHLEWLGRTFDGKPPQRQRVTGWAHLRKGTGAEKRLGIPSLERPKVDKRVGGQENSNSTQFARLTGAFA